MIGVVMKLKIRERLQNYRRVLKIAKKPGFEDFKFSAKICGLGIAVIGAIGFLIYLIFVLFIG